LYPDRTTLPSISRMEVMNSQALALAMEASKPLERRRLRLSQARPRLGYASTFDILARVTVAINVGLVVPVRDLSVRRAVKLP